MRDNCDLCHESYDDDNLGTCKTCGKSYCYRCGHHGVCDRCAKVARDADAIAQPDPPEPADRLGQSLPFD